jgi:hypothetical protein
MKKKAADVVKATVVDGQAQREAHRAAEDPMRQAASNSTKIGRLDWKRFSRIFFEPLHFVPARLDFARGSLRIYFLQEAVKPSS